MKAVHLAAFGLCLGLVPGCLRLGVDQNALKCKTNKDCVDNQVCQGTRCVDPMPAPPKAVNSGSGTAGTTNATSSITTSGGSVVIGTGAASSADSTGSGGGGGATESAVSSTTGAADSTLCEFLTREDACGSCLQTHCCNALSDCSASGSPCLECLDSGGPETSTGAACIDFSDYGFAQSCAAEYCRDECNAGGWCQINEAVPSLTSCAECLEAECCAEELACRADTTTPSCIRCRTDLADEACLFNPAWQPLARCAAEKCDCTPSLWQGDYLDPAPETAGERCSYYPASDACAACMNTECCLEMARCETDDFGLDDCGACLLDVTSDPLCASNSDYLASRRCGLESCASECGAQEWCDYIESESDCATCAEERCCAELADCSDSVTCGSCINGGVLCTGGSVQAALEACVTRECSCTLTE